MSNAPIQAIPVVLDLDEVAKLLRCPPATVAGHHRRGELVYVRIGKGNRYRTCDVLDFIANRPSLKRSHPAAGEPAT